MWMRVCVWIRHEWKWELTVALLLLFTKVAVLIQSFLLFHVIESALLCRSDDKCTRRLIDMISLQRIKEIDLVNDSLTFSFRLFSCVLNCPLAVSYISILIRLASIPSEFFYRFFIDPVSFWQILYFCDDVCVCAPSSSYQYFSVNISHMRKGYSFVYVVKTYIISISLMFWHNCV